MADEILSQLEGFNLQINRIEKEPSAFLALLQEFQEAFPSSSQSPKQVIQHMKMLAAENDLLKQKLIRMEQLHKKQLAHLSTAAKNQLRVYQDGIVKEREFRSHQLDDMAGQYKKVLGQERQIRSQQQQTTVKSMSQEIQNLNQAHAIELNKLISTLDESQETIRLQAEELSALRQALSRLEEEEQQLLVAAGVVDHESFEEGLDKTIARNNFEDNITKSGVNVNVDDENSLGGFHDSARIKLVEGDEKRKERIKKVFVDSETETNPLSAHSVAVQTNEVDVSVASNQQLLLELNAEEANIKSRQYVRLARGLKKVLFLSHYDHNCIQ